MCCQTQEIVSKCAEKLTEEKNFYVKWTKKGLTQFEQNNDSVEADEKVICGMNSHAHDVAILVSFVR